MYATPDTEIQTRIFDHATNLSAAGVSTAHAAEGVVSATLCDDIAANLGVDRREMGRHTSAALDTLLGLTNALALTYGADAVRSFYAAILDTILTNAEGSYDRAPAGSVPAGQTALVYEINAASELVQCLLAPSELAVLTASLSAASHAVAFTDGDAERL